MQLVLKTLKTESISFGGVVKIFNSGPGWKHPKTSNFSNFEKSCFSFTRKKAFFSYFCFEISKTVDCNDFLLLSSTECTLKFQIWMFGLEVMGKNLQKNVKIFKKIVKKRVFGPFKFIFPQQKLIFYKIHTFLIGNEVKIKVKYPFKPILQSFENLTKKHLFSFNVLLIKVYLKIAYDYARQLFALIMLNLAFIKQELVSIASFLA